MDNEIEYDRLIAEVLAIEAEEERDFKTLSVEKTPYELDLKT